MGRSRSQQIVSMALLLFLGAGGTGLRGQVKSAPATTQTTGLREGVIGPNDALNIFVAAADPLTKTWRVDPNGELTLPLVGTVQAAGKTVDEFERSLTDRLKEYINKPEVNVSIIEVRSQPITIMGAVGSPGTMQLDGHKTLLDVLMATGGPHEAGPTVTVTRKADQGPIPLAEARAAEDGQYSVATLNLKEIMEARSPASNLVMRPQDVISVSPAPAPPPKLVQVIGEVAKPGVVELVHQQSVTLMQALAAAGGPTRFASTGKTVIMHVNVDSTKTEVAQIDLKKIMVGRVKDIELVAGDIVVVPLSSAKSYLDTAARAMVSSSSFVLARY